MKTTDLKIKSNFSKDKFHNINLSFNRYQSNGAIAVIAEEEGEVYDYLTTNIHEDFNLKENNLVQIRSDYSQYADFLIENNFIEPQTVMMVLSFYSLNQQKNFLIILKKIIFNKYFNLSMVNKISFIY